jgi:restriction system protein
MWEYAEAGRIMTLKSVGTNDCIYCRTPLIRLLPKRFDHNTRSLLAQVSLCGCCGWWVVYRVHQCGLARTPDVERYSANIGCLKELNLNDITLPLTEVRKYLLAKRDSVYELHPRQLEEIVGSIFRDQGYHARVTEYSGDRGIDVILDDPAGGTIGVQVRRHKKTRKVEAEQIRALTGALVIQGHTKGVFVTTSSFRRGAVREAVDSEAVGHPIELVDATRFLQALEVAQMKSSIFTDEQIGSYILTTGAHLGTGLQREFTPGEDLRERPIIAQAFFGDEMIDLERMEIGWERHSDK